MLTAIEMERLALTRRAFYAGEGSMSVHRVLTRHSDRVRRPAAVAAAISRVAGARWRLTELGARGIVQTCGCVALIPARLGIVACDAHEP
jgi:hypothetical protein